MKNNIKTRTNTKPTRSTFGDLLRTFATAYNNKTDRNDPAYAKTLNELATSIAYSVLKKCINVGYSGTLVKVRRDLGKARHDITATEYASANAYRTAFTKNGSQKTLVVDTDLHAEIAKLCADNFGDGLDLVNTAVVAILEQVAEQKQRDPDMPTDLERTYTKRQLKKRVWIKTAESVNGWETIETTPIQEIFRAVRRAIQQEQPASDPRNGYTYLEDLAIDPEFGASEVIYRRFHKYADLGGTVRDYNGAEVTYTVDRATVEDIERIVEKLALTARQAEILKLRQSGYGYKAIATRLGVAVGAVQNQVLRVRKKALDLGLMPTK